MRTHIVCPAAPGRYPGVVFYSEIFQITAPIRRTAALLAGHGYIVAMPTIYHEFEPAGTVFAYDQTGSDRGNELKTATPIEVLRRRRPRRPRKTIQEKGPTEMAEPFIVIRVKISGRFDRPLCISFHLRPR